MQAFHSVLNVRAYRISFAASTRANEKQRLWGRKGSTLSIPVRKERIYQQVTDS